MLVRLWGPTHLKQLHGLGLSAQVSETMQQLAQSEMVCFTRLHSELTNGQVFMAAV